MAASDPSLFRYDVTERIKIAQRNRAWARAIALDIIEQTVQRNSDSVLRETVREQRLTDIIVKHLDPPPISPL